jgi:hypothetical protein
MAHAVPLSAALLATIQVLGRAARPPGTAVVAKNTAEQEIATLGRVMKTRADFPWTEAVAQVSPVIRPASERNSETVARRRDIAVPLKTIVVAEIATLAHAWYEPHRTCLEHGCPCRGGVRGIISSRFARVSSHVRLRNVTIKPSLAVFHKLEIRRTCA